MGRRLQTHLNQAAFLSGVAASGAVNAGLKAVSKTRQYVLHDKPDKKNSVIIGDTKYRHNFKEPAEILNGIKSDLDDIKDALVDIAKKS